ncbi:MAG: hypothetical protein LBL36_02880 [Clostridiales Family XIII bacterium]|nr:hypothetical protein [Clostridiales Family XIII bacterium]
MKKTIRAPALAFSLTIILLLAATVTAFAETPQNKAEFGQTVTDYGKTKASAGANAAMEVQGYIILSGNVLPQVPGELTDTPDMPSTPTTPSTPDKPSTPSKPNTPSTPAASGTTADRGAAETVLVEPPIDAGLTVDTPDLPDSNAGTNDSQNGISGSDIDRGLGRTAAGNWSLLSLIMSAAAIFGSILLLIGAYLRRRARKNEERFAKDSEDETRRRSARGMLKILAVIAGITTPVVWLLLDDLSQSMVVVNTNTMYVGMAFALHLALMIAPRFVKTSAAAMKSG